MKEINFIKVPHPRSGNELLYFMINNVYFQLQSCHPRKYGSWFINETVSSESFFYLASIIDPKFLVLSDFEKGPPMYRPLDQITSKISLANCDSWKLDSICDINDKFSDDMLLYRYNEVKAISWLRGTTDRAAKVLSKQRRKSNELQLINRNFNASAQQVGQSANDEVQIKSSESIEVGNIVNSKTFFNFFTTFDVGGIDRKDLIEALQIITDYLSESLANKLLSSYDMNMQDLIKISTEDQGDDRDSISPNKNKKDWEISLEVRGV